MRADERLALARRAETAVEAWVSARGFVIEARNLRLGHLEIDLVARVGRVIAVIEVRTRGKSAWTRGLGSVDGLKRQRLRWAGERLWARRYRHDPSVDRLRYDVASVSFDDAGGALVEYVRAAF